MKKYSFILQPPKTKSFTLLIDDNNKSNTVAKTSDLEKIEYNRKVFGLMGLDIDFNVQVQTALSKNGTIGVFPAGRYIVIYSASKDESKQEMLFFDHQAPTDFRLANDNLPNNKFSDNIVAQFERVQSILESVFSEEFDDVELLLL